MESLTFTPSTIILLAIILGLAGLAIKRLVSKGLCDCKSDKGNCKSCHGCSACEDSSGCSKCASH